jgi:diguanylate cyclase
MNGTFINGRRIGGPSPLNSGDRVHIGDVCLGFFLRTEQEIDSDKRLRSMATTDGLTGLLNRAVMDVQFAREFERALRYQRPLSLLLVDLDDFKKVNDTWGHLFGDYVLREAAQCLRTSIRAHDIAVRYGGEEFCVMMVETPGDGAMRLAERIRASIASHDFVVGEARTRLTVSIGVADFERDKPKSLRHFIQMADQALYEAKGAGKNCVVHWTPRPPGEEPAQKPERDLRGTAHAHRRVDV